MKRAGAPFLPGCMLALALLVCLAALAPPAGAQVNPVITVDSIERQTPATERTNANTLTWRVTFSERILLGPSLDSFVITGATASAASPFSVSTAGVGSGTQCGGTSTYIHEAWDVALSGGDLATFDGTVTLSISSDALNSNCEPATRILKDNRTPTGVHESYVLDNTEPGVTSIKRQDPSAELTAADTLKFRVTFSEDVANVGTADFTASNTTATATAVAKVNDNDAIYDVTISGGDLAGLDATVTLGFASGQDIADGGGNDLSDTTPTGDNETYTVVNSGPTVSITGVPARTGEAVTATFTFSSTVTGFTASDITATNATVSAFTETTTGTVWTATITPTNAGAFSITVPANAVTNALNQGNAAASASSFYDTSAPSVTITGVPERTNVKTAFTATFTFSKTVTGFEVGDITLTNAAASNFSGSGTTYTADITPAAALTDGGTFSVAVAAGVAVDSSNNDNTASETASGVYDTTKPTVTITGVPSDTNAAFTATFTFSEDVTGFAAADVTVTNAAVSNVAGAGASYTATITPTSEGAFSVTVAANVVQDIAGNDNTAPATTPTGNYDVTRPTVTITGVPADTVYEGFDVTFTFSEAVPGFTASAVTTTGAAVSNLTTTTDTDKDKVWTTTLTPTRNGTYRLSVAANAVRDAAGNGNVASAIASGTADLSERNITVQISLPVLQPTTEEFWANIHFSKPVTGLSLTEGDINGDAAGRGERAERRGDLLDRVYHPRRQEDAPHLHGVGVRRRGARRHAQPTGRPIPAAAATRAPAAAAVRAVGSGYG